MSELALKKGQIVYAEKDGAVTLMAKVTNVNLKSIKAIAINMSNEVVRFCSESLCDENGNCIAYTGMVPESYMSTARPDFAMDWVQDRLRKGRVA